MRQAGIPVANVERMMNAFNRAYAVAVHHLEYIDQEALLMLSKLLIYLSSFDGAQKYR